MNATPWMSWVGIAAVVLGVLASAEHGTELTRHAVMAHATPPGALPQAECPADELAEEGLSPAECRQLVSNVRNHTVSAPSWFAGVGAALAAAGLSAGMFSIAAGAGLLDGRRWAVRLAGGALGSLVLIDAAAFVAVLNAGPILRALYLWDHLTWFALHLMLLVAVLAGSRQNGRPAARSVGVPPAGSPAGTPFTRTAALCHALLALSIFFLFSSSWWMLALPLPSADFTYRAFPFQLHKNLGLTLVGVLAVLLYSRFRHPPRPPASTRLPGPILALAAVNHMLLYALTLVVVWSGYMSSSYSGWGTTLWWLVDLPHWGYEDEARNVFYSDLHLWSCWALLLVVAAHVGGALYHAFSGDGFVRRMLRL